MTRAFSVCALVLAGCAEMHGPGGCPDGALDCDGLAENGCESDAESVLTCGRCGNACGDGHICNGGACQPLQRSAVGVGSGTLALDADARLLAVGTMHPSLPL